MRFEDIEFPVYRRYKNNKVYFKVLSPLEFEEMTALGKKRIVRQVRALYFPEKNFIRDLVLEFGVMAEEATEEEYERFKLSPDKL